MGMPNQHFVEEAEALDRRSALRIAARQLECRSVDDIHIVPESIVNCCHCIQWFCHILSLQILSSFDLNDIQIQYSTGILRRNNFTFIFIQTGDLVWWDLHKFRVVFNILDNLLAINLTNPNIRYGFSCSF